MVEKEVHAFQHLADIHCLATDKHFHSIEHHCSVCDFSHTTNSTTPQTHTQFIPVVREFAFLPFIEKVEIKNAFQHLPSRAPPVV